MAKIPITELFEKIIDELIEVAEGGEISTEIVAEVIAAYDDEILDAFEKALIEKGITIS
jgi:hypothetical protein